MQGKLYRFKNLRNGDVLKLYETGQSYMVISSDSNNVTLSTSYSNKKIGETYTYLELHHKFYLYKRFRPRKPPAGLFKQGMSKFEYYKNYQEFYRKKQKLCRHL